MVDSIQKRNTTPDQILLQIKSLQSPIILLEGKRTVKVPDQPLLIQLGAFLARSFPLATFRSGNAGGADELFCRGVESVNPLQLQIITPALKHRSKNIFAHAEYRSITEINLAEEPEVVYQTRNPGNAGLMKEFLEGRINRASAKAPYLLRDTVKVIGSPQLGWEKADFALFYDDLAKPETGGTGHTIAVCRKNNVPFCNQSVWMEWL